VVVTRLRGCVVVGSSRRMPLGPYRRLLSVPGVRALLGLMVLARVPAAATGIVLTLNVVLGMGRGYGAAGLVTGAGTLGVALGSPLAGRMIDRHGLRPVVLVCGVCEASFWFTAPLMSYPVLLVCALLCGFAALPLFSVARQALAAMVAEQLRRTAFSLDSILVELSFALGPAAGVLVITALYPHAGLVGIGLCMSLAAVGLYALNPPTRSETELDEQGAAPPGRQWLNAPLFGVLLVSCGATLVLAGTDTGIVASLRATDTLSMTGVLFAAWCGASIVGGFIHGAVRRSLPPVALAGLLGLLTLPIALFAHSWWQIAIALIPAGMLCAPTLAATGEAVSRLAPAAVRGEAMGLHGSALTVGISLGAPLAGAVIDHTRPSAGFVVAGLSGLVVAAAALPLLGRTAATTVEPEPVRPAAPATAHPAAAADPAALDPAAAT
jgi:MFS family permease